MWWQRQDLEVKNDFKEETIKKHNGLKRKCKKRRRETLVKSDQGADRGQTEVKKE